MPTESGSDEHRNTSYRHKFRWTIPACSCGWRGSVTDTPRSAARDFLVKHLDFVLAGEM